MNSNTHEMDGASQMMVDPSSYQIESSIPMDTYNLVDQASQLMPYPFGNQCNMGLQPQWHQDPELRPPYRPGTATSCAPDPGCLFRSQVLDDCSRARFYARALEFYLLDNDNQNAQLNCPLAGCPAQNFKNPEDMLRHLKHCKKFPEGEFWCPTCHRYESFRVRSGSRCSWDKERLGQKLLKKSKDVLSSLKGHRPGLCAACSAPLAGMVMQGGPPDPFQSALLADQLGLAIRPHELDSSDVSELSGDHSSGEMSAGNSPTQPFPGVEYNYTNSVSSVSSASASPDGNVAHAAFSPVARPPMNHRRGSGNILNRVAHRVTGFYGESSLHSTIPDRRAASVYGNASTSQGFGILALNLNSVDVQSLMARPNLPPTITPTQALPKPTVEASQGITDLSSPTLDPITPIYRSYSLVPPVAVDDDATSSTLASPTQQQPDLALTLDTSLFADIFPQEDSPSGVSSSNSSPSTLTPNSQTSPTSPSSQEEELRCPKCPFRPSGNLKGHKAYLRKHMKHTHGGCVIQCNICKGTFTRRDNLMIHLRNIHCVDKRRRRRSSDSDLAAPRPKRNRGAQGPGVTERDYTVHPP
ncbi:hypothetical protein F4802DRAFT_48737 [Xylaria palmicola]|nr:hypothetical protein F4802DRAFT_48737 [Xylaria palmicola]